MAGLSSESPLRVGWGQLQSSGSSLSAVATYEFEVRGAIRTMVGVLQSKLFRHATMPVDNDTNESKQAAYAIANPSEQAITVQLILVDPDGTIIDDSVTETLGPGQQIAKYLWQALERKNFKGSLILHGQGEAPLAAVALIDKQGILTAIPLVEGKAPGGPY